MGVLIAGANGASQAIVDAGVLAAELARDFPEGLTTYEKTRREATAAVIVANREMQRTGPARSPDELARITETYRRDTDADNQRRRGPDGLGAARRCGRYPP